MGPLATTTRQRLVPCGASRYSTVALSMNMTAETRTRKVSKLRLQAAVALTTCTPQVQLYRHDNILESVSVSCCYCDTVYSLTLPLCRRPRVRAGLHVPGANFHSDSDAVMFVLMLHGTCTTTTPQGACNQALNTGGCNRRLLARPSAGALDAAGCRCPSVALPWPG